jgi:excisionase family DNA binding protein
MSNETPIYTLEDLEKKLKIGVRTLREYIKRGELEASKIGRAYYVTEPKLMAFIEARR